MTQKKYKLKKGLISEKLDGKIVIFDSDKSILYTLNETAGFIFEKLKKGIDKEKIVELLVKKYQVKRERVQKDLKDLIENLKKKNIIKESKQ